MNKIKIIDLLNKIANREEVPKKIKYREMIYHICYEYGDYESDIEEYRFADTKEHYYLFEDIDMLKCLNDEVEILEEKKIPEKLKNYYDENLEEYVVETYIKGIKYQEIFNSRYDEMIISKINEVLDYLKSKGE